MRDEGVQFPLVEGTRSTQRASRDVVASAAAVVDPGLAAEIRAERDWRRRYHRHLRALTELTAASPATGAAVARAGLDRLHATFEHVDGDAVRRLSDAVADDPRPALVTRSIQGHGTPAPELAVPWRGRQVRGTALLALVDDWIAGGVVEPPLRAAIARLLDEPTWLDLHGVTIAVMGAGAEMAPTGQLLAWGADIAAVDIPRDGIWRRLEAQAGAGTGRLLTPVDERDGHRVGVDLTTDAARIRAWLAGLAPLDVIGNYAYADGAAFVRVSVAADAVIAALRSGPAPPGVACLATPTDVFVVPADVAHQTRARGPSTWSRLAAPLLRTASGGRLMLRSHQRTWRTDAGEEVGVVDVLVPQQGPNYALAKRLQRWRAVATQADGGFGVVHVAPPTRTRSVVSNRVLAAAYDGASLFDVEIFAPETSRSLMAALLVHDLQVHRAGESPSGVRAEHELTAAAAHGGLWRVPWEPRTALPLSVVRGAPALLRRSG